VARAETERKAALADARRTQAELDAAKGSRKREEERRVKLERERRAEEDRLAVAGKRRAAEESRLAEAAEQRRKEETRAAEALASRTKLETDRSRLEAERKSLIGEISRLRQTATTARKTAARAPLVMAQAPAAPLAPPAMNDDAPAAGPERTLVAAVEPSLQQAVVAPARPMSITLRAPSRVQRIDFVDDPMQSSVIVDLDEPSTYAVLRTGAGRLTLRLDRAELPAGLERSLDATEYLGPVKLISTYRDPAKRGAVRIDVDMAEDVPTTVRMEGNRLFWSFRKAPVSTGAQGDDETGAAGIDGAFVSHLQLPRKIAGFSTGPLAPTVPWIIAQGALPSAGPAAQSMRAPGGGKRRYTGRRIDLDFKSADIHNILKLLADVGGVNVVTSDDVKGEVTIKMRDVPWDQALDVVLRQKQLGQVREGNLIRVAPLQVLEKELEQEIARQKQITEVLPTETRLIGVSYADAKSLTERAKDLLSPRGRVSVDERTNTLIVSDVGRNLALIEELVRNLDTQTSQVVIEARIVEARSTFVRQIGVQWGGTGFADTGHGNPTGLVFPHNIGVGGGATDGNTPTDGLVPGPRSGTGAASPNFAVNMPAAVGTGAGGALGLTLGSVAGAFNLNLRLSAMESTGQVRILSSPRISTLDNHEATISQGVSIPISVVSAQGVQTVFVDAQLNLTVKPHVTNDGTVMMDIKVTRNEPDFVNTGARGDPTILKKEANTMMLVRDGDTAVIGGIYQRNSGLNYSKVPFFADIPVIGALFKARRENDDRTEFLVFITPRIANRARALGQ
jgi:type IV pilus assembly protein PilQ